jgi:phospholipid/cholesterol/gamma-HCH transport system ATP-binding protein
MDPQPVVVKGLRKSFGEQQVLKGIDLAVNKGEILAILGKSGTGKSVLLRLLIGLEKPDSGSICIRGQETVSLQMDQLNEMRLKVGFLFQEGALYDSLTIAENVAFPLRRHTKMSDAERQEKVRALLLSVGLDKDLEKMPGGISGGMRKRVGLARALALDPEILLFDEPTAGLDPITAAEIGKLIQKQRQESLSSSRWPSSRSACSSSEVANLCSVPVIKCVPTSTTFPAWRRAPMFAWAVCARAL